MTGRTRPRRLPGAGTRTPAGRPAWDAQDVAGWVRRLGIVDVPWPTTRRLAVVVALAGVDQVAALGDDVVDGTAASRAVVHALLAEARHLPEPAAFLHQVARTQRLVSWDTAGEDPA